MTPLFAKEATAAKLLDMTPADFRRLVGQGALPRPCLIGDVERWATDDLRRIKTGQAMQDDEFEA
jgi:hypothetical protein